MEITIQPSYEPSCSLDQAIKCRNKIFFESTFTNTIFRRWEYNIGNKLFNFFFWPKKTDKGTKSQTYIDRLNFQRMDLLLIENITF